MAINAALADFDAYTDVLDGETLATVPVGYNRNSYIDLSIYGNWSGVLTRQIRYKGEVDWRNVEQYYSNGEFQFRGSTDAEYRVGFTGMDYSSGTANVRLGIGYTAPAE